MIYKNKMIRLKESDLIGSLFWIIVSLFFLIGGIRLKIGSFGNPGPGFLPSIIASLLIIFSLFILLKSLIRPKRLIEKISFKKPILATLSIFIFGFFLPIIGFFFSTLIMMILLLPISAGKNGMRWTSVIYVAIIIAIASWLIFSLILNTPFPGPRFMGIWL